MSDNLRYYEASRAVPEEAKKEITAGKLKGFTDIQPMWRIKMLTELFGPAGIGWYTEIKNIWKEEGKDGKEATFCQIHLFIKVDNEWSKPIEGVGGSMFVNIFKDKYETSDEAVKMAYTDAISVACKALGFGADVYWQKDRTKYNQDDTPDEPVICCQCGKQLKEKIKTNKGWVSAKEYARNSGNLCPECHIKVITEMKNAGGSK